LTVGKTPVGRAKRMRRELEGAKRGLWRLRSGLGVR